MLQQYINLPRPVHILCLGMFINRAGSFIVPFLSIYISEKLGYGVRFATLTIGAFGLGSMCGALVGGHLADLIGRRTVMLAGLFGGACVMIIMSQLSNRWAIMAAAFSLSLIADVYRPAAAAMIADLTTPHERSLAFGLMYVAINLGFAIAPVVGGLLADRSFQLLFWGDALTCSLYGLIITRFIRETLPATRSKQDAPSVEESGQVSIAAAVRQILHDGPFITFCLASLLFAVVFMQSMSTLPLYMAGLGISARDYGLIIAANGAMITILQLPLTTRLNRFNRAHVVTVAALVTGIGFGLMTFATLRWHFLAAVTIWTLGEIMQSPYMQAIVGDMAPVHMRARYMGVFTLMYAIAISVGVPLGGHVLARYGGTSLWTGTFVVSLIGAATYWRIRREIGNRPAPEAGTNPAPE